MARRPDSFRLSEKKKEIILYTNVTPNETEKALIEIYIKQGYKPKAMEKKPSTTVADMRKELAKDAEALAKFNEAYKEKGVGFFNACKIYTDWKKAQKK